jgi:hypothetical protein
VAALSREHRLRGPLLEDAAHGVVINIRSNRTYAIDGALGLELKKPPAVSEGAPLRSTPAS